MIVAITSSQLLWASRQFKRYYEGHFSALLEREGLTMRELYVLLFLVNNPDRDTARDVVELRGCPSPRSPAPWICWRSGDCWSGCRTGQTGVWCIWH